MHGSVERDVCIANLRSVMNIFQSLRDIFYTVGIPKESESSRIHLVPSDKEHWLSGEAKEIMTMPRNCVPFQKKVPETSSSPAAAYS